MSFFNRFFKWVPNPFKSFREHLQIEEEWIEFKQHMRPHKLKIYLVLIAASYPCKRVGNLSSYHKSEQILKRIEADFSNNREFCQKLIGFNLRGSEHQKGRIVIREQYNPIAKICRRYPKFIDFCSQKQRFYVGSKSLQISSKDLAVKLAQNNQFQHALQTTLVKIVNSNEVKGSFIHLIQSAFSSPESITTIINLLKKGIQSQEVKHSVSGTVNYSVQELLKDDETMNQLKIFMVFLLRKFQNDDQIKNMIDIIFAKSIGLTKKKKQNQLQKLLKEMDQKIDKNEFQK